MTTQTPSNCLQVEDLGAVTVVTVTRRTLVDIDDARIVGEQLLDLAGHAGPRQMLVNLGNVEHFTSMTLGHLLACQKQLHREGGRLVLCNLSPGTREVLRAARLEGLFDQREGGPDEDELPLRGAAVEEAALLAESARLAGPRAMPIALFEPRLDRAGVLLAGLLRDLFVVHFADLGELTRYCERHPLPVVALPLWPSLNPATEQAVLQFIRTHGRRTAIVAYADTGSLSIGDYSRPLAVGARQVVNEAAPTFVDDLRRALARLVEDHLAQVEEEEKLGIVMARHGLIGQSPALRDVFRRAMKASYFSDLPVLILGETGTGKQRLAEAIHALDPKRRDRMFLTVNCGAISKTLAESELFGHSKGAFSGAGADRPGLFRAADGGTLLLDEVGELDPELQPKLLRVLQERRLLPVGADYEHGVDVRIIAATNRPLEQLVAEGKFRQDLYQRLNVFQVRIPPLRERPEDIEPQVQHFLQRFQAGRAEPVAVVAPRVLEALRLLPWEGNTRQLEHLVRELLMHKGADGTVQMEDLPRWVLEALASRPAPATEEQLVDGLVRQAWEHGLKLSTAVDEFERRLLEEVLKQTSGNQTRAATLLGLTPRSVYNKIKKHGLDRQ